MKKELRDLIKIAQQFRGRPDLVQGAGGNLSVKLNPTTMLIKASGLRFSELKDQRGFVAVNYAMLRARYAKNRRFDEKQESQFLLRCANSSSGKNAPRPSMEAGFHAFLGRYVLHTHSVYANTLNCSRGGRKIALALCRDLGIDAAALNYYHPGPDLAAAVHQLADERATLPTVIFLGNHGLVISGDTAKEVVALHQKVNTGIKRALKLDKYPLVGIRAGSLGFTSKHLRGVNSAKLKKLVLFPDQAVFCANEIKRHKTGRPTYATKRGEAMVMEEIINAWSYILRSIPRHKWSPLILDRSAIQYLTNMEAEKHRKKIAS